MFYTQPKPFDDDSDDNLEMPEKKYGLPGQRVAHTEPYGTPTGPMYHTQPKPFDTGTNRNSDSMSVQWNKRWTPNTGFSGMGSLRDLVQPDGGDGGTYGANNPDDPSKFMGYNFGAHQGQTFSYRNPAEGAKYAVSNYLNNVDPNDPQWATRAAEELNKQFGSNIFVAEGGQRLRYGDEAVDSTKQAGKFFWIGAGGGAGGGDPRRAGASAGHGASAGVGGGAGGQNPLLGEIAARLRMQEEGVKAREAETRARTDELYKLLQGRATQTLNVGADDPAIRAQADAYAATNTRAMRDHLANVAERVGPLGNTQGESRIAAERLGEANAGFEAELMGRELSARRAEISDALNSMRGMLSQEQQINLQRELANIDAELKRYSFAQGNDQFARELAFRYAGLNQQGQLTREQMAQQNNQFNSQLGFNYNNIDNELLRLLLSQLGG